MKHISQITPVIKEAQIQADSKIEMILFYALRNLGIDCVLQYPLKGIRVDIAIPQVKLSIECDGKDYHQDKLKDESRDRAVRIQGWEVERYSGSEIYLHSEAIAISIARRYRLIKNIDEYDKIDDSKTAEELIKENEKAYWENFM